MNGFTSGKISHDVWPFTDGLTRFKSRVTPQAYYAPRPEFEHDNPILVQFRQSLSEDLPFTEPAFWSRALTSPSPGAWSYATLKHRDHARRVLTKLAAL